MDISSTVGSSNLDDPVSRVPCTQFEPAAKPYLKLAVYQVIWQTGQISIPGVMCTMSPKSEEAYKMLGKEQQLVLRFPVRILSVIYSIVSSSVSMPRGLRQVFPLTLSISALNPRCHHPDSLSTLSKHTTHTLVCALQSARLYCFLT